jgi:lipopolysaccharide/colanic/teichoic acid biosynthesis glycosyltransferase
LTTLRRVRVASPSPPQAATEPTAERPAALASAAKRALDVALASVLLVASVPIWLVAALIIRTSSPGPVLFRQERLGVGATPFTCYKFRTMHHGASDGPHRALVAAMLSSRDSSEAGHYKLNSDDRIIGAMRWMRRTSLDEIPQLINVLRGEMSIVGPRPPLPYEVEQYEPWQFERLHVRPGITGLWQVSGRNRLSYREMCALDVKYVRDWNFTSDLMIILSTPWVMFVDRGGAE